MVDSDRLLKKKLAALYAPALEQPLPRNLMRVIEGAEGPALRNTAEPGSGKAATGDPAGRPGTGRAGRRSPSTRRIGVNTAPSADSETEGET